MDFNEKLQGKYKLERLINKGGFAPVFQATEEFVGRSVAIKMIPKASYPQNRQRYLLTEMQTMGMTWGHPNIVAIHTVEPGDDECFAYIVMEYVDGDNLSHILSNDPLPQFRAVTVALDICRGLMFAHKHSIIHRDIKPQNIMITSDQTAKITDFGVARILEEASQYAGTVTGTRKYMAPEQYEGNYDTRVDLYSTGVIIYEMLTGKYPFLATDIDKVKVKKEEGKFDFPQGLRQDFCQFLHKALQPHPDNRYQTAEEIYRDLDSIRESMYKDLASKMVTVAHELGEHKTLNQHRDNLRMLPEVAEQIELQIINEKRQQEREKEQQELKSSVESHHQLAIENIESSQPKEAIREIQQIHRLYLSNADEVRVSDRIFSDLLDAFTSSYISSQFDKLTEEIAEFPLEDIHKLRQWLNAKYPNQGTPRDGQVSRSEPIDIPKPSGETEENGHPVSIGQIEALDRPEIVLYNLHQRLESMHEVNAFEMLQNALRYSKNGKEWKARKEYRELGHFYRGQAQEFSKNAKPQIAADFYKRSWLAYQAANRDKEARRNAEDAGWHYAQAATDCRKKQIWGDAARLFQYSAENYGFAERLQSSQESWEGAATCYFNAAEDEFSVKHFKRAYAHCEKVVRISSSLNRPSNAVTAAKHLMEEITKEFGEDKLEREVS
ncbi:MAG: serine/threonine-protein kinase [Candidatus Poribacteria bacterium]|nr:serine/threonine-protein kinase [Candidatus Poribacteria bacterium]